MALVMFDLNGTLLDPGEHAEALQQSVRLAMAHTLADDFRPFAELLATAGASVPGAMATTPGSWPPTVGTSSERAMAGLRTAFVDCGGPRPTTIAVDRQLAGPERAGAVTSA